MKTISTYLCTALSGLFVFMAVTAQGQDIRKHYVSKSDGQATIYHTFPCTLFENNQAGDLTYDLTYRDHGTGCVTLNFTYVMAELTPADSVRFVSGKTVMQGSVEKLYITPDKKRWKHRYTFSPVVSSLYTFYNVTAAPQVTVYSKGRAYVYNVKQSAWKSYAPIGDKIFRTIRINEE